MSMTFGAWCRQERKRKHLSQAELAKMVGMSHTGIGTIERGLCAPYKKSQRKIAAALNAAKDRTIMPAYSLREERAAVPAVTVVTNGDAMRAMDDEELVFLIKCPEHECLVSAADRDCYGCKLNWLKRPAG